MVERTKMTGRLVAAGRALTGVSLAELADVTGVPIDTLRLMEANGSAWLHSEQDAVAITRGLEHFGIVVLYESEGLGAGVRLKFTRQDAKQIGRLEAEGGIVSSDHAP
jgi:hypothetical protein